MEILGCLSKSLQISLGDKQPPCFTKRPSRFWSIPLILLIVFFVCDSKISFLLSLIIFSIHSFLESLLERNKTPVLVKEVMYFL